MSLREDSLYLASVRKERQALSEATEMNKQKEINDFYMDRMNEKDLREQKVDKYYRFITTIKEAYLTHGLYNLCESAMVNPSSHEKSLCKNVIYQYIKENGVGSVLRKMKRSPNRLLREMEEDLVDTYRNDIKDADPDDEDSYGLDKSKVETFWKDVDKSDDVADMTNLVRIRVANAEEDFVNKVQQDKANIDTVMQDTAERVQNAKESNGNEYSQDVEEFYIMDAKKKIYDIKHEDSSVFAGLVKGLSKNAIRSHNDMVSENGRLDLEKIIETSRVIYTVLETFSVFGLEKVNSEYIKETLNSLN
jgi:hypothetical protein